MTQAVAGVAGREIRAQGQGVAGRRKAGDYYFPLQSNIGGGNEDRETAITKRLSAWRQKKWIDYRERNGKGTGGRKEGKEEE